jgi:hypothetical protein
MEPCFRVSHVRAAYSERTITLTLYTGQDPSGGSCFTIGLAKTVTVVLSEPVDGRQLIDGADDGG